MKKKYSLALGGGAALGILHIGVIKYLEENDIKIKEISGTSMGALVASFYAIGKTSKYMRKFAKDVEYIKLLDFDLKNGLLKGNKIYKKLEEVFGDKKIEDLDIKLKIIATDIENGKKKVFTKGKIVDAVRASISLPGIFIPHEIKGKNYVDGGILNNLPIDDLEGKNIIAVSSIKSVTGLLKRKRKILGFNLNIGFFNMNFQILQRSLLLMMKGNEDASIANKKGDIILVRPDTNGFEFHSFNKVDGLINIGYNEIKGIL